MTRQHAAASSVRTERHEQSGESHDNGFQRPAVTAVEKTRRAWWPLRTHRRDHADSDTARTPVNGDDYDEASGPDEHYPESTRDDETQVDASANPNSAATARRQKLTRTVSFGVVPVLVMVLALGVGYLKYLDSTARDAQHAGVQSVQAAKDATVAMLSYTPDTADKDLTAARDRLTGEFRGSYASLIHDVVIPGAKEKKVSAVASVPAAASVTASPDHAVVLVYVNQAITMGDGAPTQTNSVVQVTLVRSGDRWLISGFDPK